VCFGVWERNNVLRFQNNEKGREDIEILVFEENVQNTLVFFKNQGQFCIFS